MRTSARTFTAAALLLLLPGTLRARDIAVPAGTTLYGETEERVTSRVKKEGTEVGDVVKAHVWRDVTVDGQVVIKAGTPMLLRVSEVKKAKLAGIKGQLELEAVSTKAVDGDEVLLDGGYDKSGHGRKALSISLAAVESAATVSVEGEAPPRKIKLGPEGLKAEVLYDNMNPEGKDKTLPVKLTRCDGEIVGAAVASVDGQEISPEIPVALVAAAKEGDCTTMEGAIDLKELGKHLTKGINRFEIGTGGVRTEVLLDIEL
jgi:hypothetical protein